MKSIHFSAVTGDLGKIEYILQTLGTDRNLMDDRGNTPLLWAAKLGHETMVVYLLAREGTKANMKDEQGRPVLSYATEKGLVNAVSV